MSAVVAVWETNTVSIGILNSVNSEKNMSASQAWCEYVDKKHSDFLGSQSLFEASGMHVRVDQKPIAMLGQEQESVAPLLRLLLSSFRPAFLILDNLRYVSTHGDLLVLQF